MGFFFSDIITKVHLVDIETEEVKGPFMVRGNFNETVGEYKEIIAKHLKLPAESLHIAVPQFDDVKILPYDDSTLRNEDFYENIKIFVVSFTDEDEIKKPQVFYKLKEIIDVYKYVITLTIALPHVDNG